VHAERTIVTFSGFLTLALALAAIAGAFWLLVGMALRGRPDITVIVAAIVLIVAAVLLLAGLYTLQPNEAAILQLFGAYRGTSRVSGLRSTNPFYTRRKISLRARNLNGERLKVNDKRGNPIEIAAVVIWRVQDTAQAVFDVDDYESTSGSRPRRRSATSPRRSPTTRTTTTRWRAASRRCWPAPTWSPGRWCANSRRASTRPASWSRRRGSPISPTLRRSRR
jgi:hypothetical protein